MVLVNKPHLKQLNTEDYKLNQVQVYTNSMSKETNRYIDLQKTNLTVVSNTSSVKLTNSVAFVNVYVTYKNVNYDPFATFDYNTSIFTAPVSSWFQVCSTNVLTSTGVGLFGLFGQVNKTSITPSATIITNYDVQFDYRSSNAAGDVMLNGNYFIYLNNRDTFKFVIYSSLVAPVLRLSQSVFKW